MCWFLVVCLIVLVAVLIRLFVIDKLTLADIKARPILVTGSGAGFGRAFVKKCLEEGMTVFASCRRLESAEQLQVDFAELPGHLDAFQMDITSEESVHAGREHVCEELKKMDKQLYALVNNAGMQASSFLDDFLNVDDYRKVIEVNTLGTIRATQCFKPLIKKSRGRIVFCTSSIVRFSSPSMGPYATSKWAVTGYVEVLRHELRPFRVDVATIEPGIYLTNINEMSTMMQMLNDVWTRPENSDLRKEYGEYFFSAGKRFHVKLHEGAATDLGPVVDAYLHAVAARYPYRTYSVGLDSLLLYRPYSYLCPRLQEIVIQAIGWWNGFPKPDAVD